MPKSSNAAVDVTPLDLAVLEILQEVRSHSLPAIANEVSVRGVRCSYDELIASISKLEGEVYIICCRAESRTIPSLYILTGHGRNRLKKARRQILPI